MLGRFIPDFGRIVAQMQYDMYHVYTVDEHTLSGRSASCAEIENGDAEGRAAARHRGHAAASSRAARSMSRCCCTTSPRARGGDQAMLGEPIALQLARASGCDGRRPRRSPGWSRSTCVMSDTAFKRDIGDPQTIQDFVDHRAVARAAEAAAGADRGRHPRGRAGRLERLEGPAAARALLGDRLRRWRPATRGAAGRGGSRMAKAQAAGARPAARALGGGGRRGVSRPPRSRATGWARRPGSTCVTP